MKEYRRSLRQVEILLQLEEKPARTITELANRVDALRPSISRSLRSLREQQLVYQNRYGWHLTAAGKTEASAAKLKLVDLTQKVRSIAERTSEVWNRIEIFGDTAGMTDRTLKALDTARLIDDKLRQQLEQLKTSVQVFAKAFSNIFDNANINFPRINISRIGQQTFFRGWFGSRVFADLKDLREYANLTENLIDVQLEKTKQLPIGEEGYWRRSEDFPYLLRSSLVVTCYSLIECRLNELCGYLYQQKKLDEKWDEYRKKRKGIDRAISYLQTEAGISLSAEASCWQAIYSYERIRNIIVYADGYLDEADPENDGVREYIEHRRNSTGSIHLDELNYLKLEKKFCFEVIDDLEAFFHRLFSDNWPDQNSI